MTEDDPGHADKPDPVDAAKAALSLTAIQDLSAIAVYGEGQE